MIKYRIQERKWMCNAIERKYKRKWKVIIGVFGPKKEMDSLVDQLYKHLYTHRNMRLRKRST